MDSICSTNRVLIFQFTKGKFSLEANVSFIPFLLQQIQTFDGSLAWELPFGDLHFSSRESLDLKEAHLNELPPLNFEGKRIKEEEQTLFLLGERIVANWDRKDQATSLHYYLLNISDSQWFSSISQKNDFRWITAKDVLSEFENNQIFLSSSTLQVIRNILAYPIAKEMIHNNLLQSKQTRPELQTRLELVPNVLFIPMSSDTTLPFSHTNLVVFHSNNECLIVDPGSNQSSQEHLLKYLQHLSPKTLKIFLTHHHYDHWEALPFLSNYFPEAVVFGHQLTMNRIQTSLKIHSFTGSKNEMEVGNLKVFAIYAPGHTDGHAVLWEPISRTLVPGDHVVGFGSAMLDTFGGGDMQDYFATTHLFISLNPRIILPAHGPPSFNPIPLLKTYIKHRQEREDAILACYLAGHTSLNEIFKIVYQNVSPELWKRAKSNILLHLKKLSNEGKIPRINL